MSCPVSYRFTTELLFNASVSMVRRISLLRWHNGIYLQQLGDLLINSTFRERVWLQAAVISISVCFFSSCSTLSMSGLFGQEQNGERTTAAISPDSPRRALDTEKPVASNPRSNALMIENKPGAAQLQDEAVETMPLRPQVPEGTLDSPGAHPWELPDFNELTPVSRHESDIIGLFVPLTAPSSATGFLLSVDQLGCVIVWRLGDGRGARLYTLPAPIEQVDYLPERAWLVVSAGTKISLYSLSQRRLLRSLDRVGSHITDLKFQPGGQAVLIGGADGRVYRWRLVENEDALDAKTRDRLLERYIGHSASVSAVAYHPLGRTFFSGDIKGEILAWLTYDRDMFGGAYDENLFPGRAFAEAGPKASAGRPDSVSIVALGVSADGKHLFAGLQDGRIEWRLVRGFAKQAEVQAHKGTVYSLSVNDAGTEIVSAGRDGKVKIWEVALSEDWKVPSSITLKNEYALADVRQLVLVGVGKIFAGEVHGRVLEISSNDDKQG